MPNNHTQIKLRRGTAAEWTAANELLLLGEPGFEKDTYRLKIGDGVTLWNDLPYIDGGFGGDNGPLEYIYDVNMGSDDTITPTQLGFDSVTQTIDYSTFYNDIIDNDYAVTLKLTSKSNSDKFLITKSTSVSKNNNVGDIDAFWPSSSIQWIIDGGNDQYDSANFINNSITTTTIPTDSPGSASLRQTSIPYNAGNIDENSQYWGANDYVTLYKKNIFAMVARGNATTMPHTVYYAGNTGADGDGDKDTGTLTDFNGYQAGYCRIWGDDPTYTKLIITKTGTVPTYSTDGDNDTNDDLFVASGIDSDTIAMVVFYANDTSNPSSIEDIQILFESFVSNVLVGQTNIADIRTSFYSNHTAMYDAVDSSFWYPNFEFFTGTNEGSINTISAENIGGSGSGLSFDVSVDQDTMKYVFSINNAGTNYQAGDIVVLRGNNLNSPNGRSPDEDIYIIIDSVDIGGEVLTYNTISDFVYNFNIDQILARSDGFRFVDNETYYLNVDIMGLDITLATISGIASGVVDNAFNTNLIAGSGISLDYDSGNLTINTSGVSYVGHNHIASDIVSGTFDPLRLGDLGTPSSSTFLRGDGEWSQIPVQDIISGTGISVTSSSGIYTISSTGSGIIASEANALVTTVFNKTGTPIPKFSVVYINGGQGDMPTIALASASGESNSSKTYGITAETINHMSTGKVIVEGALTGINTDQFNPTAPTGDVNGTILYLSTTPGGVTTTKQLAPNHLVSVGTIVRTHQNQGVVEVRIQNGFELQELHNVYTSGLLDNHFLVYNSGNSLWEPSTNLTFDGELLSVSSGVAISGPSGLISATFEPLFFEDLYGAGPTVKIRNNQRSFGPSLSMQYFGESGTEVDPSGVIHRATPRLDFIKTQGTEESMEMLDGWEAISVIRSRAPAYDLSASLVSRIVTWADGPIGSGNIHQPTKMALEVSSGASGSLDRILYLYGSGELSWNGFATIDDGLSAPTPIISLGTVSGNTAISYDVDKQIQQLTLNGTAVNFTEGTGWDIANRSVDVLLEITVTSLTTVAFDSGFVTDWYNPLPTFSTGKYLVLLRSVGSGVVQGHYIGAKTN